MKAKTLKKFVFAVAALFFCSLAGTPESAAKDTIKVGILHSLSGTMAISESSLKDTVLMLIREQNAKGGILGKQLEPVVVDPASDWSLFSRMARKLISQDKVDVVFGCWTSASRKAVLPVFKELNSVLFYPVQYEGQESERNVFYTGAAPNQQAIPAVDYLREKNGIERWVLVGTDYVYPRTTNEILEAYLKTKGVMPEDIMIRYAPFGHRNWLKTVGDIKKFGSAGKKTAVISTINGDSNVSFYKELAIQSMSAKEIPVMAFSVGERELAGFGTGPLVGHMATWNYFQSSGTFLNSKFVQDWKQFTGGTNSVTNDPMEALYIGFHMWVKAVEKANSSEADKVIAALPGTQVSNLTGGVSTMLPNHHLSKPVLIGEIQADGQFKVKSVSEFPVEGDAWSDYLPGSDNLKSDWINLNCGKYDTEKKTCLDKQTN